MKAWPPRLSRPRMVALLALVLVGAGSAWWMLSGPPQLHLRRIIEPPAEFHSDLAEIQGFSPDGSLLVVEHEPDPDDSANTLILRHVNTGQIEKIIDRQSATHAATQLHRAHPWDKIPILSSTEQGGTGGSGGENRRTEPRI